jgi:hypothetical protein
MEMLVGIITIFPYSRKLSLFVDLLLIKIEGQKDSERLNERSKK